MTASLLLHLWPWLAFGAALACAYVGLLRWNIDLYLGSRRSGPALLVHVVRRLLVVAALLACARHDRSALWAALLGFGPSHLLLAALLRDARAPSSGSIR